MWCLEGEISQDNVHWCGPTIGDPFCAFASGVGSPEGKKRDRRQTGKQTEKEKRGRTMESERSSPHRWNAVARLCFVARFAPFLAHRFPLLFCYLFVLPLFSHFVTPMGFDGGQHEGSSSEARTETTAEVGRCSLEISTRGHFWGLADAGLIWPGSAALFRTTV